MSCSRLSFQHRYENVHKEYCYRSGIGKSMVHPKWIVGEPFRYHVSAFDSNAFTGSLVPTETASHGHQFENPYEHSIQTTQIDRDFDF